MQLGSSHHTNTRKGKASVAFDDEFEYLYGIVTTGNVPLIDSALSAGDPDDLVSEETRDTSQLRNFGDLFSGDHKLLNIDVGDK
uniref:Uncharacterized protein n=1 Tax=Rhizophagus irregularis (strain DAOM 181602 / DAOM 197198 / MUCL 43194) TaxID=747089 RepID=U9V8N5_RHIID